MATVCLLSQGPCQLNSTCSGSNETCPVAWRPPSHECASSRGPCENSRYCTGQTPECNLSYKNNTEICGLGSASCEKSAATCSGSSHLCPSLLLPNGTSCGNRSECTDTALFCNGNTGTCPLRACERCEEGKYGQDCSCTTGPPSWLLNPYCNRTAWFSGPNETIVNDKVISSDGNIVVFGNFSQLRNGTIIMTPGSNLTVLGVLTPDGTIIIDLSKPGVVLGGGKVSISIAAGSLNGSGFPTVSVGNFVPPKCQVVKTDQSIADLPPSDDDPSAAKKLLSITISLTNDPQCDQDKTIVIAASTSAVVGAALAGGIFAIYLIRRRRESELRDATKDRLAKVQRALTDEGPHSRHTKRFTNLHLPGSLGGVRFKGGADGVDGDFAPPKQRIQSRRATAARPKSHYSNKARRARRKAIHESAQPTNFEDSEGISTKESAVSFAPPKSRDHYHARQRRHVHSKHNPRFSAKYSRAGEDDTGAARKSYRKSRTPDQRITRNPTPSDAPENPPNWRKTAPRRQLMAEPGEAPFAPLSPAAAEIAAPRKTRKSKRTPPEEERTHSVEMQLMTASYVAPITFESRTSISPPEEEPEPSMYTSYNETLRKKKPKNSSAGEAAPDFSPYESPAAQRPRNSSILPNLHVVDNTEPAEVQPTQEVDYTPYETPEAARPRKSSLAANLHAVEAPVWSTLPQTILIESYKAPNPMESSFKPPQVESSMESSFKPPDEGFVPPKGEKRKRIAVLVDSTRSDKQQ